MAPRGRMSTVTITGEHRLHEESMLSHHLIRAKPVGIELKTITRQPLMDAVADPTQRRKGTSGDHGFVELMMPRLCRFPVDCAFAMLAYVPFIKGEAGDHTVSPGVVSKERGKPFLRLIGLILVVQMPVMIVQMPVVRGQAVPATAGLSGQVSSVEEGPMEGVLVSARQDGSTVT